MKIILTEKQINILRNYLINEGIEYSKNPDYTIDFTINHDTTDKANIGGNSADTRVFGKKNDILHNDGTARKNNKSISQHYKDKKATINFYKKVIEWAKNGDRKSIYAYNDDNLPPSTLTAVMKWYNDGYSDNRIINDAQKSLNRVTQESIPYISKYERVQNDSREDKIERYNVGIVPGTDVKYVALFSMTDFNFSDAIKHGKVRQNGNTDKLLGVKNKKDRESDASGNDALVDLTYDNRKYLPDIARNFSLKDVNTDHYKQQFGMNGEGGYSSINQFLDKSVMYANHVLQKIKYIPDFIISAPSSSKFNDYYCQNLSNKLGKPYIKNFFERNLINVKWDDGRGIEDMRKNGFSETEILKFTSQIKNIAYTEIAHIISEPIKRFCMNYEDIIKKITINVDIWNEKDYEVLDGDVITCIIKHAYDVIIKNIDKDTLSQNLSKNFRNSNISFYSKYYTKKVMQQYIMQYILENSTIEPVFNKALVEMMELTKYHINMIKEKGYKLNFTNKKFKITNFEKQFRPFLKNVYIVADTNLNKDGALLKRYENGKFLVFDEDINSGVTLKFVVEALREKIPDKNNNSILCLVNALSNSGY